jgi:hypothetical protein
MIYEYTMTYMTNKLTVLIQGGRPICRQFHCETQVPDRDHLQGRPHYPGGQ